MGWILDDIQNWDTVVKEEDEQRYNASDKKIQPILNTNSFWIENFQKYLKILCILDWKGDIHKCSLYFIYKTSKGGKIKKDKIMVKLITAK